MPKITLEIVTPEKVALTEPADFVVLPAFEGEMGILPNHEAYLVQLTEGEIRVTAQGAIKSFAVSGGFAEIKDNKVSVFAETAEMAEEINTERALQALERAKAGARERNKDSLTLAQAESAMRRALVRLRVAELKKRRGSVPSHQS